MQRMGSKLFDWRKVAVSVGTGLALTSHVCIQSTARLECSQRAPSVTASARVHLGYTPTAATLDWVSRQGWLVS